MPAPHDAAHGPGAPIDAWLIPPDNPPQRVADKRRQPMRLSALFEEFCQYLRVEKEAAPRSIETYRWCFGDFESFAMQDVGGTVLVTHFTADRCRDYLYALSARGLQTNSIRVRLATLGSFGKWAVRREKLDKNPLDLITRPRRKARLPRVLRWETVERLLAESRVPRERAIIALASYGALRRSEVVALDVGDYDPEFGLRRVQGKGGAEAAVPLPAVARAIVPSIWRRSGLVAAVTNRCSWSATAPAAAAGRSVGWPITGSGRSSKPSAVGRISSSFIRMRSVMPAGSNCIGVLGGIYGRCKSTCGTRTSRRRQCTRGSRSTSCGRSSASSTSRGVKRGF